MVERIVRRPWSTVKSFLDRTWMRGGDTKNLSCSRRPEKLNRRDRRQLVHAARSNRTITRRELRDNNCSDVSISTVDRILRAIGIKK